MWTTNVRWGQEQQHSMLALNHSPPKKKKKKKKRQEGKNMYYKGDSLKILSWHLYLYTAALRRKQQQKKKVYH